MAHIKALDVDWLNEASVVMFALRGIKEVPVRVGLGLLCLKPLVEKTKKPKLELETKKSLELTLQTLTLHLFYRLKVAHKVALPTDAKGTGWFHDITNPDELHITWVGHLDDPEKQTSASDKIALEAAFRIAHVLREHYCNSDWKHEIPLLIARIGGKSASAHARLIASATREQRPSPLLSALSTCLSRTPTANWKELLRELQGDGIVTDWDEDYVYWMNSDDCVVRIKTKSFQNLITQARKLM